MSVDDAIRHLLSAIDVAEAHLSKDHDVAVKARAALEALTKGATIAECVAMRDATKEWNKLVAAHEDAVRAYGNARSEDALALLALEEARGRSGRAENMVTVKLAEAEVALGALLRHTAATGRA